MVLTLIFNLLIVILEVYVFLNIRDKKDIFKFYTYLQNFISLIISIITCFYIVYLLFSGNELFFIRGLRYIGCCGLIMTMIIYTFLLSSNKDNCLSDNDFVNGFNYKVGNLLLHYICPTISLISFVFFERWMGLSDGLWSLYAAIPSILYFIIYIILSLFRLWDEPYNFKGKSNSNLMEIICYILIPIIFIVVSFAIWNIK